MIIISDLVRVLQELAPLELAEDWDNVGLILGDPSGSVDRVMTCLTVTAETAREAIEQQAQLIVSHHPILFRPVKKLVANDPSHGFVWSLARHGVAVYSAHTAFDNAEGGINALIARRLGLQNVAPLLPPTTRPGSKIVVFTPVGDRDAVLLAAFQAGAGRIGDYTECSFATPGQGTFLGGPSSNPTVGQPGKREVVEELRLEVLCPDHRLPHVLSAIRRAHSYEEPAIDVYPLASDGRGPGRCRIGDLPDAETLRQFIERVASTLPVTGLQWVGDESTPVRRVAIACGAADEYLKSASHAGADVFLTGEARFHRAFEARSLGLALVLAGHHATERPGVEHLASILQENFPSLSVWASASERDPLQFRA